MSVLRSQQHGFGAGVCESPGEDTPFLYLQILVLAPADGVWQHPAGVQRPVGFASAGGIWSVQP